MSDECRLACGRTPVVGMTVECVKTTSQTPDLCEGNEYVIDEVSPDGSRIWLSNSIGCPSMFCRAVPPEQPVSDQSSDPYAAKLREIVERWENGGWRVDAPPANNVVETERHGRAWRPIGRNVWIPVGSSTEWKICMFDYWRPISQPPAAEVEQPWWEWWNKKIADERKSEPRTTDAAAADEGALIAEEQLAEWEEQFPFPTSVTRLAIKEIRRLQPFEQLYNDLKQSYAELESRLSASKAADEGALVSDEWIEGLYRQSRQWPTGCLTTGNQVKELVEEIRRLQAENRKLKAGEHVLRHDAWKRDAELAELRSKKDNWKTNCLAAEKWAEELRAKNEELRAKLAEREKEIVDWKAAAHSDGIKIDRLGRKLAERESLLQVLFGQIEHTAKTLGVLKGIEPSKGPDWMRAAGRG